MLDNSEWLDENSEIMKQIPPEEKRIASFELRREAFTLFRGLLAFMGILPIILFTEGGRHGSGPIIEVSSVWRIGAYIVFFVMMVGLYFLGKNEKGHIDIYPEMIVFYDYDPGRREARPCQFYYWKDIVQYHAADGYIWLGTKESEPVRIWGNMDKMRPYFEQYAPHAEVVRFSMSRYKEKRRKQEKKEEKAAQKAARKAEKEADEKKED